MVEISYKYYSHGHMGHIAKDVQYLASFFPAFSFSHVHKHCSYVAYSLCKMSNYRSSIVSLDRRYSNRR